MRLKLLSHKYDILIIKDFSRFSRRNSLGLVELENLRDAGVRIISIGDNVDYPTNDDWIAIQFRFLINEMPVTDSSKKVRNVISYRQKEGKWICSVPYGYVITNSKTMQIEVDSAAADVVKKIFELYIEGYGYKKIANYLTDHNIPTPRMNEKTRKESSGEECKIKARSTWSIITISGILENDFYIGTLRQHKYSRKKINGSDVKIDETEHIVFEKHHPAIIDDRTFEIVQEQLKMRSVNHYRGIKKYSNNYSGLLFCGDCGSPMFSMSRSNLAPAYTCGSYHKRGLKGCTSHHTRVDFLNELLKKYIRMVRNNSQNMLDDLQKSLDEFGNNIQKNDKTVELLQNRIDDAKAEMKTIMREKTRQIMKNENNLAYIDETYDEMISELSDRINGLSNQLDLTIEKRNSMIKINRTAKTVIDVFDDILNKEALDKVDIELIVERITVFENHIDIMLKSDIDALINCDKEVVSLPFESGTDNIRAAEKIILSVKNRKDKIICVNIISNGDPLEIYTSNDGEVIFKKYSAVNEMAGSAAQVAEVMTKLANCPTIVFDRDHVVAVAGVQKKEFSERRVSQALEEYLEGRKNYFYSSQNDAKVFPVEGIDRAALACSPILASGDVTGAVAFLSPSENAVANEVQQNLIQAAAQFLGKQIEE